MSSCSSAFFFLPNVILRAQRMSKNSSLLDPPNDLASRGAFATIGGRYGGSFPGYSTQSGRPSEQLLPTGQVDLYGFPGCQHSPCMDLFED